MRIDILASSSAGNAIALREGDSALLLEAGLRYRDLQRALDHRVSHLDGCLITHEHGDHVRAAAEVMKAGVDVYASAGTLAAAGLTGHRAKAVARHLARPVAGWNVMPFEAIHDAAEPLNFLIARGPWKVLYLTDTAYCPYRFNGLTHILLEANYSLEILRANTESGAIPRAHMHRVLGSHMSIERAVELLQANDLSRVQEIHLLHLSDGNSDADAFRTRVARATGRPVYIAPARRTIGAA